MLKCLAGAWALLAMLGACGYPELPPLEHRVGGRVHGLWDGADGVALRLQADGIDTLLTVAANGDFGFTEPLAPGASYTVTVATNPAKHTCVVDTGGNGTVADVDVTSVSIVCTGPAVAIALSGPWDGRLTRRRTPRHSPGRSSCRMSRSRSAAAA